MLFTSTQTRHLLIEGQIWHLKLHACQIGSSKHALPDLRFSDEAQARRFGVKRIVDQIYLFSHE